MHRGLLCLTSLLSIFTSSATADYPPNTNGHSPPVTYAKRIAIIGAGAAGSSTAFHLRKFAEQSGIELEIVVFERSSYIGGRSTTINAFGNPKEPVELGASIFVDVNTILQNATKLFGLEPKSSKETDDNERLGIWNGQGFVFEQKSGGWKYWDIAKMLWKYGLAPIKTRNLMRSTVKQYLKLYEPPFFPFRSLTERAIDLGLIELTNVTGQRLLNAHNIGAAFSTDIIQASTRVNYATNLDTIHGVETMVCMSIEGAKQIEGGNWQIFQGMLDAANVTIRLNTTVSDITKQNNKYVLKTSSSSGQSTGTKFNAEAFDTVVLAAPFQFSDIKFAKDLLKHVPQDIPYVRLHVTLMVSPHKLHQTFFSLANTEEVPTTILTTLPPDEVLTNPGDSSGPAGFFSISTLRSIVNPRTNKKEYLYKIFSPEKVTSDFLSAIFGTPIPEDLSTIDLNSGDSLSWYYPHVWHSYPVESPRATFEELELAKGFYYTSGMDSFISSMESNALMGMNVAQLIIDDHLQAVEEGKIMVTNVKQSVLVEE